jgi:hypothetical protein
LLTSDYVVDEILTLLKQRDYADIAFAVGAPLIAGEACQLEYVQSRCRPRVDRVFIASRQRLEFHRLHKPGRHGAPADQNGLRV